MIWDDRKGVMKSAGLWHKFKTHFDIGHAREQNAATLAAIKDAIVATFPSDDLKELAEQKINLVRTDRLIGAAEIRGILDSFEHIGSDSEAAIKERTKMHMAAHRDLPMRLWCVAPEVVDFVSTHIARDPDVRRDPRNADIKGMTATLVRHVSDIVEGLQDGDRIRDDNFLRLVVRNLEGVAWKTGANGKRVEHPDAGRRIGAIVNYYRAALHRGNQVMDTSPMFMHRAMGLLDNLLKLPDPYDHLVDLIRTAPPKHVENRDFAAVLTHLNSLYAHPADTGPMLTEADILPVEDDEFSSLESPRGDEIG